MRHNLVVNKLIASRTLSEYAWLAKAEAKAGESPQKPDPGYEGIWEEPENG
jgi:hypothetical protein